MNFSGRAFKTAFNFYKSATKTSKNSFSTFKINQNIPKNMMKDMESSFRAVNCINLSNSSLLMSLATTNGVMPTSLTSILEDGDDDDTI